MLTFSTFSIVYYVYCTCMHYYKLESADIIYYFCIINMKHLANHVTATQEMLGRTLPLINIGAVFFMSHNGDYVERFRLEGPKLPQLPVEP